MLTDNQTGKQTNRQTNKQTKSQTDTTENNTNLASLRYAGKSLLEVCQVI